MANSNKPNNAPRNRVACAPILRKGGVHQSETKSARLSSAQLRQQIGDWREELAFERSLSDRSESSYSIMVDCGLIGRGWIPTRQLTRLRLVTTLQRAQ